MNVHIATRIVLGVIKRALRTLVDQILKRVIRIPFGVDLFLWDTLLISGFHISLFVIEFLEVRFIGFIWPIFTVLIFFCRFLFELHLFSSLGAWLILHNLESVVWKLSWAHSFWVVVPLRLGGSGRLGASCSKNVVTLILMIGIWVLRRHASTIPSYFLISLDSIVSWTLITPIRIKNNKIVILRDILLETIMLGKEPYQLLARPIISKLFRLDSFCLQHVFKKCFPMSTSLHRLVDVEIKQTKWLNLFDTSSSPTNKEISFPNFYNTYDLVSLSPHVQSVIRGEKLAASSDDLR